MKKYKERKKKLVSLFKVPSNPTDRLAYSYLFSMLSAVEQIAVIAAERGAGVEGQLEDELVHRDAFKKMAKLCGGYKEQSAEVNDLINYLTNLQGEKSIAALNVVAEGWLGCIFEGIAHLSPDVFNSVGEDENRHNGYALSYKIPNSNILEPIIRDLEYLLYNISQSPNFLLPLMYLIGLKETGKMGLKVKNAHLNSCKHLDVPVGPQDLKQYTLLCKTSILYSKYDPIELPMTTWQKNKQNIWNKPHTIVIFEEYDFNLKQPFKVQAKIIEAIGKILKIEPRFNTITKNKKLFSIVKPHIGVRHVAQNGELSTIFVNPDDEYQKILKKMLNKIRQRINKEYKIVPDMTHLVPIIPPCQYAITLSYIGAYPLSAGTNCGTTWGFTNISETEGNSISLFLGENRNGKLPITFVCDHRVHDGKDIGLFAHLLKGYLQS